MLNLTWKATVGLSRPFLQFMAEHGAAVVVVIVAAAVVVVAAVAVVAAA